MKIPFKKTADNLTVVDVEKLIPQIRAERDAEILAKISEMENRSNEVTSSHPTRQYAMELLRELRLWAEGGGKNE